MKINSLSLPLSLPFFSSPPPSPSLFLLPLPFSPLPLPFLRPLPPELIKYAREDTHYLLYIYDRMRNELIRRGNKQNNFLHSVLDRSRDVSLIQYQKPLFSESDYLRLYHKHKKTFNSQQVSGAGGRE